MAQASVQTCATKPGAHASASISGALGDDDADQCQVRSVCPQATTGPHAPSRVAARNRAIQEQSTRIPNGQPTCENEARLDGG